MILTKSLFFFNSFNEIGNLRITNASSEEEGQYECLAENVAGVASKAILLQVHGNNTVICVC